MSKGNYKHGMRYTRLYNIWRSMRQRCNNPNNVNYKNYGGRGISVCSEWDISFTCFMEWALANGYQEHLTIDRINNDGNYEPSNCRWATYKEQSSNKRNSRPRIYAKPKSQIVLQEGETAKEIPSYEGRYLISSHGRVWSLQTNKELHGSEVTKNGNPYAIITLTKNNIRKEFMLRKLVAELFIPNPCNYKITRNIDGNIWNNSIDNIEWVETYDQSKHVSSVVKQYDMNGSYIKTWGSIKEAASVLKIHYQCISSACRGKAKSAGGFKWQYATSNN